MKFEAIRRKWEENIKFLFVLLVMVKNKTRLEPQPHLNTKISRDLFHKAFDGDPCALREPGSDFDDLPGSGI